MAKDNVFDRIYDSRTVGETFGVSYEYISRIVRGKNSFPEAFIEGVDFKLFGSTLIISDVGVQKFEKGFKKIRNK